ncbi:MAG: hypothetical protein ACI9WS_001033, partial [Paraglaciecola psychrophila]
YFMPIDNVRRQRYRLMGDQYRCRQVAVVANKKPNLPALSQSLLLTGI